MASVIGRQKHVARLRARVQGAPGRILRALFAAGQELEILAERSITEGSISGANHVPSAPGEPPNADTRLLDTSIETTVESPNPPVVHVTSNAPYSKALEYGTAKMAERPFMRPAAKKARPRIVARVTQALRLP